MPSSNDINFAFGDQRGLSLLLYVSGTHLDLLSYGFGTVTVSVLYRFETGLVSVLYKFSLEFWSFGVLEWSHFGTCST